MTNSNDPNLSRSANRETDLDEISSDYTNWVAGAFAALIVILGIYVMIDRKDNTSTAAYNPTSLAAATTTPAPATVPPETTGSAVPSAPKVPAVR